jgi:hypothetical protein
MHYLLDTLPGPEIGLHLVPQDAQSVGPTGLEPGTTETAVNTRGYLCCTNIRLLRLYGGDKTEEIAFLNSESF